MENKTLIGDDATIEKVELGTEQTGDGAQSFDELAGGAAASGAGAGMWRITAKAASGSIFGELKVGRLFISDGTEVPVVGDKAQFLSCTPFLDATSWNASFSASEVETTKLVNKVKTYRRGKADAEGTIKGIYTLGVTGEDGGLLNQFVEVVKKKSDGSITISDISSAPLYIRGVIRDTDIAGETLAFIFAQIELYGINLGGESGSSQSYDSKFRFLSDPVYYEQEIV